GNRISWESCVKPNSGVSPLKSAVNNKIEVGPRSWNPAQVNSSTDKSNLSWLSVVGLPANTPLGSTSTNLISQRSASNPAFFCARQASFLPSGENWGPLSAALLSPVKLSGLPLASTPTRQMS